VRTALGLGTRVSASLRLGTRGSALALAQSQLVADALTTATGWPVELVRIVTEGDRSAAPVAELGIGVFVSALRDAVLAGDIDFAVHSYKDLPTAGHPGLFLAAVPEREDPRDALIARDGMPLASLPPGARVGTGACAEWHNCTPSAYSCRSRRSAAMSTAASPGCSARSRPRRGRPGRAGVMRLGRPPR
jgi:hypothetical protein